MAANCERCSAATLSSFKKDLMLDRHQPHLVRCVRDFLRFARAHGGYSFDQSIRRAGRRAGITATLRTCRRRFAGRGMRPPSDYIRSCSANLHVERRACPRQGNRMARPDSACRLPTPVLYSCGKNGKSCRISASVGLRPYSQISNASAYFTSRPRSGPYQRISASR